MLPVWQRRSPVFAPGHQAVSVIANSHVFSGARVYVIPPQQQPCDVRRTTTLIRQTPHLRHRGSVTRSPAEGVELEPGQSLYTCRFILPVWVEKHWLRKCKTRLRRPHVPPMVQTRHASVHLEAAWETYFLPLLGAEKHDITQNSVCENAQAISEKRWGEHTSVGTLVLSCAVFSAHSDFKSTDVFPAPLRTGLGTMQTALPRCPDSFFN